MSFRCHPSSVWPDVHAIAVTQEQANLMLDYVVQQHKRQSLVLYVTLKHMQTDTIHILRLSFPTGSNKFNWLTERHSSDPGYGDWFAGMCFPEHYRSSMINYIVDEYYTPYEYFKSDTTNLISCRLIPRSQSHFEPRRDP